MRRVRFIPAAIYAVCLILPSVGGVISLGMAQDSRRLTSLEAIAAARPNAKPGSSFTVLREIIADADTRRVGDQALEQARTHRIKLFRDGILVDLLRSGGFLIAEYDPKTTNVVAQHLVSLGPDGLPKDVFYQYEGVVKLADAKELVKDTTEFTEKLYSTPPSEALSLESRFYGGSFPDCSSGPVEECTLFAAPHSLLKLGADPNEVREVAALDGGLVMLGYQHAVSMPTFADDPAAASRAAEMEWEALGAAFLRNNHMNPETADLDPAKIRSKQGLQERIDLLGGLDQFLEENLRKEADPAIVKANISVATIPLGFGAGTENGQMLYGTGTPSLLLISWQRVSTGGFAVKLISESDAYSEE